MAAQIRFILIFCSKTSECMMLQLKNSFANLSLLSYFYLERQYSNHGTKKDGTRKLQIFVMMTHRLKCGELKGAASWSSGNAFVRSGMSEVQISSRSNWTQSCQRLATAATFLRKELCFSGAMTRRWAPQTCYRLPRNTTSTTTVALPRGGGGGSSPPIGLKSMQNSTFLVLLGQIFAPKMTTAPLPKEFRAEVVKDLPLFGPEKWSLLVLELTQSR